MINPPKKDEEEEILDKEEEPKEIFEDETKESNIEIVIEPEEKEKEESEPVKPKRTRKKKEMTEASKKQLEEARIKSLEKRRANAQKRKQEQEEKELTNKKYIDEIELLKQQINELKINNKPKIIEKEKEKTNDESEYKFSLQDLEFYAESYMKKHKEIEDEVKHKRNKQVRDKYFLQLR